MRLDSYPSYKQSGISWCENIPQGWDVQPLYALANECSSSNKGMIEDNLLSLSYGKVINKDINSNDGLLPESFETYQVVEADDIVLRLTDLQNDKRSLRSAIVKERGIITSAYLAIRAEKMDARFLNYLLRAYDLTKVFYSMGGGLRQSMKFSDVRRLPLILPSLLEQKLIATFLDHETEKIETLVAAQAKLIELMKEKRQAFISNAVTKGIDPQLKMKESGVEWLGEIPENWDVRKASNFFTAKKGTKASQLTKEYCATIEGEYPVYSGQTENNGVMSKIASYEFDSGDGGCLFATTVGAKAMTVSHIKGKFSLSQNCMIILATQSILSIRFYYYHLQPLFFFERALIPDHMQPSFRMEDLYSYRIAVPPLNEQERIVEFLDSKVDNFSKLIAEASVSIDLLKERRSALISAAVTGQIDVRNYQAKDVA